MPWQHKLGGIEEWLWCKNYLLMHHQLCALIAAYKDSQEQHETTPAEHTRCSTDRSDALLPGAENTSAILTGKDGDQWGAAVL